MTANNETWEEILPLYVVTGFLSTGKSAWINQERAKDPYDKSLVIAFEEGITSTGSQTYYFSWPQEMTKASLEALSQEIVTVLKTEKPHAVYMEWNGMLPFQSLEALLYKTSLDSFLQVEKVIFVTNDQYERAMRGYTGPANEEQRRNADLWIGEGFVEQVPTQKKEKRNLFVGIGIFILLVLASILSEGIQSLIGKVLPLGFGIFLQAMPFLLIGIVLSSLFTLFVKPSFIEKQLRGNPIRAMLLALVGGLCFPFCDCATIPFFRTLTMRGVPLPVGIAFMLASPIMNPISLLATYYAFGGQILPVLYRAGLGALVAAIVGLSFWSYKGLAFLSQGQGMTGGQENPLFVQRLGEKPTKMTYLVNQTQEEFFKMCPYLFFGIGLSTLFQVYGFPWLAKQGIHMTGPTSILFMMAMAFLLSLCSTSDAIVAKTFGATMPFAAVMSFLLLGPMIDLKNIWLLKSLFPKGFIFQLAWRTAFVVLLIASILYYANDLLHLPMPFIIGVLSFGKGV